MWKKALAYTGLASVLLAATGVSHAAVNVTVNSTQPEVAGSNYQTINAALNYAKTQTEPRTVRITGGGPYTESLLINFSVTVRGDGYRPIIVAPPTAGGPAASVNGNGISLFTTSEFAGPQTFRLENFVLIPAVGNAPTRAIRSNNNASGLSVDDMTVEIVDVLVTANNGSNQPVSTDGLTQVDLSAATLFADDLLFFSGYVDVACTGTIATNNYGNAGSTDGLVFFADAQNYNLHVGPGCVFSFCNRIGIQIAADGTNATLVGTEEDPIVFKGNFHNWSVGNAAFSVYYDDNSQDVGLTMEHVLFLENNSLGMNCLFADETDSITRMTADKVAFVSNDDCALALSDLMTRTWTITNSTVVNNAIGAGPAIPAAIQLSEEVSGSGTGTVTFTDSVLAGNGTPGDVNTGANHIAINAPNMTISFVNCGIPTAGPYALGAAKYALFNGSPAPTETNVLTVDPEFVAVNADFASADFLDVEAAAYDNAATGGADLSGYGDWVGGSGVDAWSLY